MSSEHRSDFFVGGGSSALASEGSTPRSDWHRWAESRGGAAGPQGPGLPEDLAVYAEHGVRQLRVTVDWSRLEPRAGIVDDEFVEYLLESFSRMRELGMHPWVTLHHTMLPGWFADDTDGFRSLPGPSIHWSRHVDRTAEMLDGLVAGWIPTEDPLGWALRSHHLGTLPGRPGEQRFHDACEGALEATFEAHRLLASGDAPVVSSFGMPAIDADDETPPAASGYWTDLLTGSWTEAIRDGVLRWPWRGPVERPDLADAFDAIGLALVPTLRVDPAGELTLTPPPTGDRFGALLRRTAELVGGRELVLTGVGLTTEDDAQRNDAIGSWLEQSRAAHDDGVVVRGAFLEPLADGIDPDSGRLGPTGIFDRGREPKPSVRWLTT